MRSDNAVLEHEAAKTPTVSAADAAALAEGRHADPFSVLGPHPGHDGCTVVRAYLPGARGVTAVKAGGELLARLEPTPTPGLFAGCIRGSDTIDAPDAQAWRTLELAGPGPAALVATVTDAEGRTSEFSAADRIFADGLE